MREKDLNFYRLNFVIGGVLIPLFWLLHFYILPGAIDPLWMRLGFGFLSFLFLGLSFVSEFFRKKIRIPFFALFYLMVIWLSYLVWANSAHPSYAVTQFIWLVVFCSYFDSVKSLLAFIIFSIVVSTGGMFMIQVPLTHILVYVLMLPAGLLVNFVSLLGKLNLRKDLEHEKSELNKFMLAVANAGEHIIITDKNGVIIFANKAVEKITGYTNSEVLGRRPSLWGGLMPKEFYARMWDTIKNKKQRFMGAVTNKRKNGEIYLAQADIAPILNKEGEVEFFVGIERDVTKEVNYKKEIENKVSELSRINELMIGREIKMVELKEEIEKLKGK